MESSPSPRPSVPQPSAPQAEAAVVTRQKPGPKPWASALQWDYLQGGVADYRTAQSKKGKKAAISNFLDDFMPEWWLVSPLKGTMTAAADRKVSSLLFSLVLITDVMFSLARERMVPKSRLCQEDRGHHPHQ